MEISRTHDIYFSIAVIFAVISSVLFLGDALYIGIWYYFVVPSVALCVIRFINPMPLFQFGAALGIAITFLAYLSINWFAEGPEGLLGLGHIFSLPGSAISLFAAAYLARNSALTIFGAFLFGLSGFLISNSR